MDIHRCRFVPFPPHSINALAFSHESKPSKDTPSSLRLAVGRGNGDIEIWNPNNGLWFQESIFRGGKDRSIEGLVWTKDTPSVSDEHNQAPSLRLFSIGDSRSVTEWDLGRGIPKRHVSGNAGDIWCMAAQPKRDDTVHPSGSNEAQSSQLLAAGCGNGDIVLFSTSENDLQYWKSLPAPAVNKPKVLSITWRDLKTIVAGYDDSAIRVYNVDTRTIIRTMNLGPSPEGGESYVWCVKCLKNGTILSGDSSGELKIWEAKNLSLYQRLKAHAADILDVETSADGDQIFTVGVDRRTVVYQQTPIQGRQQHLRWTETMHRRFHQHDTKSIATFESKELSVAASGGVDTIPVIAPIRQWKNQYHRALSNLPQRSQTAVSSTLRLFITWWDRELWIWQIKDHSLSARSNAIGIDDRRHSLLARLVLKGDENITSADISEDGRYIIVSSNSGVKLFQLRWSFPKGRSIIRSRQGKLPVSITAFGARIVKFSPDGRWSCTVRLDNTIVLARVLQPATAKDLPILLDKVIKLNPPKAISPDNIFLGTYSESISRLIFSPDSRSLVSTTISGTVNAWVLEGVENSAQQPAVVSFNDDMETSDDSDTDSDEEDNDLVTLGQRWVRRHTHTSLPNLGSPILALAFRRERSLPVSSPDEAIGMHATRHNPHPISPVPLSPYQKLVVITARHEILEYDLTSGKFSDWSRRNPSCYLPEAFTRIKERIMDCFFDPTSEQDRLWMYGPTWLFMLDMSQDLSMTPPTGRIGDYEVQDPRESPQKKRKVSNSPSTMYDRNTGAGDNISSRERYLGPAKQLQKLGTVSQDDIRSKDLSQATSALPDRVDGGDQADALTLMRRDNGLRNHLSSTNGDVLKITQENDESSKDSLAQSSRSRQWWHTFNYRSILGVLPLTRDKSARGGDRGITDDQLEVVLIERPIYDIDLPPRFGAGQEWDT